MHIIGFFKRLSYRLTMLPFLLIAAALVSCSEKQVKKETPPTVAVCPVITKELPKTDKYIGQVVAIESVDVVARISGYLERRLFEPGDYVKKGQLLFQIQKDQFYAQLNQAQGDYDKALAGYENMVVEYNRQKQLVPSRAVSVQAFDNAAQNMLQAKGEVLTAKGAVTLQKLNISYTDVFSPLDGRIGMYKFSAGNVVGNNNVLATVMQVDPIWIEFPISETVLRASGEYAHPYNGQIIPTKDNTSPKNNSIIVKALMASGEEYPHRGEINYIDNKIDPLAGTIQVRAIFPNPKGVLVPGGFIDIAFESKAKVSRTLVYQPAIQQDLAGFYVYVVNPDNIVEKRYIEKGNEYGMLISVTKGVVPGEKIVVSRVLMTKPGMKVTPVEKLEYLTTVNTDTARAMNPN